MDVVARLRAAGCVFAEQEAALLRQEAGPDAGVLEDLVRRRVDGLPLEHVVGWVAFAGLRVRVTPGVFVPRRRTEYLLELAAENLDPAAVVVDVCCGSGAVAAGLLHRFADLRVFACDIDERAVACARLNLPDAHVHRGDLLAALPGSVRGQVAVITANAPYVPTEAVAMMPPEARDHEPRHALDGGPEGTSVHRRLAEQAPEWLAPGGTLLIETGAEQAPATAELCQRAGLTTRVRSCPDVQATVVTATRGLI